MRKVTLTAGQAADLAMMANAHVVRELDRLGPYEGEGYRPVEPGLDGAARIGYHLEKALQVDPWREFPEMEVVLDLDHIGADVDIVAVGP
jgi:hypothetical protein